MWQEFNRFQRRKILKNSISFIVYPFNQNSTLKFQTETAISLKARNFLPPTKILITIMRTTHFPKFIASEKLPKYFKKKWIKKVKSSISKWNFLKYFKNSASSNLLWGMTHKKFIPHFMEKRKKKLFCLSCFKEERCDWIGRRNFSFDLKVCCYRK